MFNKSKMIGSLAGLGFFLALTPNITLAEMPASAEKQARQFQKIEQPFGLKLAVALGGLGLIGAELWWFMFSNCLLYTSPSPRDATLSRMPSSA